MSARFERERAIVADHFPSNTRYLARDGHDVWIFKKTTQLGDVFEIAIYLDPDEQGYVAQLISPEVEAEWRSPHIGHIFSDGVICLGTCMINGVSTMRAAPRMLDVYSKACLWAEGISIMIASKRIGSPVAFPFSSNNEDSEVS